MKHETNQIGVQDIYNVHVRLVLALIFIKIQTKMIDKIYTCYTKLRLGTHATV